jgi:Predicted UDP-glucose 6-dehydrogenase
VRYMKVVANQLWLYGFNYFLALKISFMNEMGDFCEIDLA